ncbi:MAG: HD domain-containing protein [Myxococcales bacterium]|nr:HD domain-containing protein [Myxococcales bacterium]
MQSPNGASGAKPPEKVELVRKVFARDLKEKDRIHTVFLASRKQKQVGRSGKAFLVVSLADRSGEIDARVFDEVEKADGQFAAGDYVLVRGNVITFHGKLQVVIDEVERLDPEPIDAAEFRPPPEPEREEHPEAQKAVSQIRELAERVQDPFVQKLLVAFLDDPELAPGLALAPAAKGVHHAYKGGLADHILSSMRLAHRLADHYPMADRDLLVAGALLHDICKVQEIAHDQAFEYTDEGRLVGHLVMTAQKIREKASRIDGFPPLLEQHLTHVVLAHHGELGYGSPKVPVTLEALLVHFVDLIDSRVGSWLEFMAKDPNERWTDVSKLYGRHLWKGAVPTVRNRGPVEPRRRAKEARRRERHRPPPAPRPERPEKIEAPAQAEAAPQPKPPRERDPELPKELTFKPFSVLTGGGPPAPEGES